MATGKENNSSILHDCEFFSISWILGRVEGDPKIVDGSGLFKGKKGVSGFLGTPCLTSDFLPGGRGEGSVAFN